MKIINKKMNNFFKRLITGIVFIVAVLGGILLHKYAYLTVFGIIVLLGMVEMRDLLKSTDTKIQAWTGIMTGIFLFVISFFIIAKMISILWLSLLIPMIISVYITELFLKSKMPITNIATTLFLPFYIALPFCFLHFLAFYNGEFCGELLIAFFILSWSNDTFAYLVGINFGKRRLYEEISPKKSWEGTIGGFLATLLVAFVLSFFFKNFTLTDWLIIGGIISIMGVFGDLTESMIKRSVNKKDSGSILPGHGGILDRFDSITFAAPIVFCYLLILKIC